MAAVWNVSSAFGLLEITNEPLELLLLLLAFTTHLRILAVSFLRFRDHTQWHIAVGRTFLDEWSAHRRDLYLTNTQHSQQTNINAPGGIRTRNPSGRAAADPRLRPLGHWDRRTFGTSHVKFGTYTLCVISCLQANSNKHEGDAKYWSHTIQVEGLHKLWFTKIKQNNNNSDNNNNNNNNVLSLENFSLIKTTYLITRFETPNRMSLPYSLFYILISKFPDSFPGVMPTW